MSAALGSAHAQPTAAAPAPGAALRLRASVKVTVTAAGGTPLGAAWVAVAGEDALDTAADVLALIAAHYDAVEEPGRS